jgi:hypothetical protein
MKYGLLIVLIVLAGCAHSMSYPQQSLPPEFLGYWRPFSTSAGTVGLNIRGDGTMTFIVEKNRKPDYADIYEKKTYRVIKIKSPTLVYVFTINKEEGLSACVELELDDDAFSMIDITLLSYESISFSPNKQGNFDQEYKHCRKMVAENWTENAGGENYSRDKKKH